MPTSVANPISNADRSSADISPSDADTASADAAKDTQPSGEKPVEGAVAPTPSFLAAASAPAPAITLQPDTESGAPTQNEAAAAVGPAVPVTPPSCGSHVGEAPQPVGVATARAGVGSAGAETPQAAPASPESATAQAGPAFPATAQAAARSAVSSTGGPAAAPAAAAAASGIEQAIAHLASAIAPGSASGAAAKSVGLSPASKAKPAPSGEDNTDSETESAQAGAVAPAAKPAVPAVAPTPAAPPVVHAQGVEPDTAKSSEADTQPAKVADAPPGTPFLAGADSAALRMAPHFGTASAAHGPAQVIDNVPLGNVPVEIGLKSLAGVNHFEIRLAPDDLGRIDVKLHIDAEGRVKAHLVVDRPETLAFLQRDTAQLQQTLEQAGLKTQDDGVSLSLRNPSSDQGFGQDRGGTDDNSGRPGHTPSARQANAGDAIAGPARRLLWPRASGVDLHI